MIKNKWFAASTTILLLSSGSHSFASPEPRAVKSDTALSGILSTGVGLLPRGDIPENATSIGLFLIPNGASNNPSLTDGSRVTFQNTGNRWVAKLNNVNLTGSGGADAYFSNKTLNPNSFQYAKFSGNQVSWEDTFGGGDGDYNDAILNVTVQNTTNNTNSQISLSGTSYDISTVNSVRFISDSISSDAGYNSSFGHYFADVNGNPIAGIVDFANLKLTLGVGSPSVREDYKYKPFVSGSTLQFYSPVTAIADIEGVNIAAVDVSLVSTSKSPVLQVQKSAFIGLVTNSSLSNTNNLIIQVSPNVQATLTGTTGVLYDNVTRSNSGYRGLNEIYGITPSTATVEMALSAKTTIDAPIGASGRLKSFKMSGKSVELTNQLSTDNIQFTIPGETSALILTGSTNLTNTNVVTASTKRLHHIHLKQDQTIEGNIGTESNPLGTIKLLNNNVIKINTSQFYTDVNTNQNNTGRVEFTKAGSFSYSLGETQDASNNNDNALLDIKFSESAEVRGSAFSKTITVATGKTASFKKRAAVSGSIVPPVVRGTDGINLLGAGSGVVFGDLAVVRGAGILTATDGQGTFKGEGSIELQAPIGSPTKKLLSATFDANSLDKNIILARDINSQTITFNKSRVIIDRGCSVNGTASLASTNIDIGQHIFIFTGGNSTVTGDPALGVYFDNNSNSHITVTGASSNLNFAQVNSLTFNMTDNSTPPPAKGREYKFFREENGGTVTLPNASKVVVNQPKNPFVKWTYNSGTLNQQRDVENGITKLVLAAGGNANPTTIKNALTLVDPNSGGSTLAFLNDLAALAATDVAKAGDALNKVLKATNPTANILITTSKNVQTSIVAVRINNNNLFQFRLTENSDKNLGVAAGDNIDHRHGAWVAPFYGKVHQKQVGDEPGDKSRSYGGTIGYDIKLNDDLMLGLAGTFTDTKVDYKAPKDGDKSKIHSFFTSIYGLQNLPSNWFLQGIASFGYNRVKNTKVRISPTGLFEVIGKYTSRVYGVEMLTGYNYSVNESTRLIPTVGLRYDRFFGNRYDEKGFTQNISVDKKTTDRLEAIAGVKLAKMIEMDNFILTPEAHGAVNYNLSNKTPSFDMRMDGSVTPMSVKMSNPPKAIYNLGFGLKADRNMMEYAIAYDAHLAKKYTGHQGVLKIRVNF